MKEINLVTLVVNHEENLVGIRDASRRICEALGFKYTDQVRITTSVSEIARNIYEYAGKGTISFLYFEKGDQRALKIIGEDEGPGVERLDEILAGTYVSATGMGVGIKGARSLMDDFEMVSEKDKGSKVTMVKFIPPGLSLPMEGIQKIMMDLKATILSPKDAMLKELEIQNQELMNVLEQLNVSNSRLEIANSELVETNQGIVALNNEMALKNRELDQANKMLASTIEQLNVKNADLKAFTYTVSHDLKAPLRGITGYAQEMNRKHAANLSERGLFCLSQIFSAARHLDSLIEDLLRFSRLETEAIRYQQIEIRHLVESVLKQRHSLIEEQGIELTCQVEEVAFPGWENGLMHAISNLVDNAIKFSAGASPPVIRISVVKRDDQCQFEITDNGIGFDMAYHDRLFELFHRLVRQEEFEGTGAGLAIVKRIIDKHNGKIWARSEPGQGATFIFTIPCVNQ